LLLSTCTSYNGVNVVLDCITPEEAWLQMTIGANSEASGCCTVSTQKTLVDLQPIAFG